MFALDKDHYQVCSTAKREETFLLYPSMELFFANGGGLCYIVAVGTYADAPISSEALESGIDLLEKEQEPTMVVIPDAVHLAVVSACTAVQKHAINHCGKVMKNRVAILDIYDGFREQMTRPAIPSGTSGTISITITWILPQRITPGWIRRSLKIRRSRTDTSTLVT